MRTKSEIVRNTRHAAKINRSRSKVYRRMDRWKEEDVGTDKELHTIFLKKDWSFSCEEIVHKKTFVSVHDAMCGISLTYPCKKIDEDASIKKELAALKSINNRILKEIKFTKEQMESMIKEIDYLDRESFSSWKDIEWINHKFENSIEDDKQSNHDIEWINSQYEYIQTDPMYKLYKLSNL